MACFHPLKGFVLGLTDSGKKNLKIVPYGVDHIELRKGSFFIRLYLLFLRTLIVYIKSMLLYLVDSVLAVGLSILASGLIVA